MKIRLVLEMDFEEQEDMKKPTLSETLREKREAKEAAESRRSDLEATARNRSRFMFEKLRDAVKAEVEDYSSDSVRHVSFKYLEEREPNVFFVERDRYPLIYLAVEVKPETGLILAHQSKRLTASTPHVKPTTTDIIVVARGADDLYYRIEGNDYPDEKAVSDWLLGPLLSFVEDNS